MKKLTPRYKSYLVYKSRKALKKKSRKNKKFIQEELILPRKMNLDDCYTETVAFFHRLREMCGSSKRRFTIKFTTLKEISPSAALALTAEIDRVKKIKCFKRMKVINFEKWERDICFQLRDMGMFKLLNVTNLKASFIHKKNPSQEMYIPFLSGNVADGDSALSLQDTLTQLIEITAPNPKILQKSLTEAMTNSINHAYPDYYLANNQLKEKLWWMSASLNTQSKILTIMFYDEGIGIPKSLPRTYPEAIKSLGGLRNDDAQLIKAATKLKRTSTYKPTRGKGLKDIKDYISCCKKGWLTIYSCRGEYNYFSNNTETICNRRIALPGTLIQWKVNL